MEELFFSPGSLGWVWPLGQAVCVLIDLCFVTEIGQISGLFSPRPGQMFRAASLMSRRAKILEGKDLPLIECKILKVTDFERLGCLSASV